MIECPEIAGLVTQTAFIIIYLVGGGQIVYDLTDPRTPLPRFRSLTVVGLMENSACASR